jgi:hypothetical protein
VTTRHYFETDKCIAADPTKMIPLSIEPLDPVGPNPAPTDESIAASIRAVGNWMRGFTLEQPPMLKSGKPLPSWVSVVPNKFNQPALPDGLIYWRFVFPDEPIQPIATKVVPLASLAKH